MSARPASEGQNYAFLCLFFFLISVSAEAQSCGIKECQRPHVLRGWQIFGEELAKYDPNTIPVILSSSPTFSLKVDRHIWRVRLSWEKMLLMETAGTSPSPSAINQEHLKVRTSEICSFLAAEEAEGRKGKSCGWPQGRETAFRQEDYLWGKMPQQTICSGEGCWKQGWEAARTPGTIELMWTQNPGQRPPGNQRSSASQRPPQQMMAIPWPLLLLLLQLQRRQKLTSG